MPADYTTFPENGPVYELLQRLGRHAYRATHIHSSTLRLPAMRHFPSTSPILGDDIIFTARPSLVASVTGLQGRRGHRRKGLGVEVRLCAAHVGGDEGGEEEAGPEPRLETPLSLLAISACIILAV